MVAAVGNRVEALHRSAVGALTLPEDLAPGQWRWLDVEAQPWQPRAATA
jgi:16S rRNA pseudouridine516 synthase